MSTKNHNISKKAAAGAALVALSSFVPQPMLHQAMADTTTLNVTGKFITGITLAATNDIKLGSIIASAKTGFVNMDAAAATAVSSAAFAGTPAVGKIKITAAVANPLDVKIAGFGKLTLTGGSAAGTATLTKVYVGGADVTSGITVAGGTSTATATVTGLNLVAGAIATPPGTLTLGSRIAWTGSTPVGTFSQALTVTITY